MQQVQFTPAWKKISLALVILFSAAVIVVWAKPTGVHVAGDSGRRHSR